MANWNSPINTTVYTSVLSELKGRDTDSAYMFDPAVVTPTNLTNNTIRWNSVNSRFEILNGTWGVLDTTYDINVTQLGGFSSSDFLRLNPGSNQTVISGKLILNINAAAVLDLKSGTADEVYLQLYADAAAQSIRSGYIGFFGAAGEDLDIVNEFTNGNVNLTTNGSGKVNIVGALTVTGLFNSSGIDDNATSERLQISDTSISIGSSTAVSTYSMLRRVDSGDLHISGGSSTSSGANILLYGGFHTNTGDLIFRNDANILYQWDESVGNHKFYSGTSSKTLALTIDSSQNALFAGTVTATNFIGPGTGLTGTASSLTVGTATTATTATTVTTNANLTGPVTSVGNATSIGSSAINQTMLAFNSVGQSEVKTNNQTIENTSGSRINFIATGGIYVMGHLQDSHNSNTQYPERGSYGGGSTDNLARWNWTGSSVDGTLNLYYINSSPPYDLGDGEILYFIELNINNSNGKVVSMSAAVDPVWAYNGPTNIIPSRYAQDGRTYRLRKNMNGIPMTMAAAKAEGTSAIADYFSAFKEAPEYEEEITQAIKNADKDIVTHALSQTPGQTQILLDPMSPILETILELAQHDEGSKEISDIVLNYLNIGNTQLNRKGPAGILIPSIRWKNTL